MSRPYSVCASKTALRTFFTSLMPLLDAKLLFYSIENVQMKWISLYFVCVFAAQNVMVHTTHIVFPSFLVPHFQLLLYRFSPLYYPSNAQSYANLFSALSDSFPIQIITCVRNIDSFFFHFLFSFLSPSYIHVIFFGIFFCVLRLRIESDKPKYELVECESKEMGNFSFLLSYKRAHLCRQYICGIYCDTQKALNCYGKCMKIKHFT